jgi:hypothetical protein
VYNNNAGTMMDRNLGATNATPGEVGALGLLYQWGRKDPFLGSSSIEEDIEAKSTITWPSSVFSDSSYGTIDFSTSHPTTFIMGNGSNRDWYFTGVSDTDNTRWQSVKTIYDPCPVGWRVPNGGSDGIWSTAFGSTSKYYYYYYDKSNRGMDFAEKLGLDQRIWYPASGCRHYDVFAVINGEYVGFISSVGIFGTYWSVTPNDIYAYQLCFSSSVNIPSDIDDEYYYYGGYVKLSSYNSRADCLGVRCVQESE